MIVPLKIEGYKSLGIVLIDVFLFVDGKVDVFPFYASSFLFIILNLLSKGVLLLFSCFNYSFTTLDI